MNDLSKMTGPELVAEYNRVAALISAQPVSRFASRTVGQVRVATLRQKLPASWTERTGYGRLRATEPKHALNMTPKQRRTFHTQVVDTYKNGGTEARLRRWP